MAAAAVLDAGVRTVPGFEARHKAAATQLHPNVLTSIARLRYEDRAVKGSKVQLEELKPGLRLDGVIPAEVVTVVYAGWHGSDAVELTYRTGAGGLGQQVVFRSDEARLSAASAGSRAFDADANDFKLVAEAQRISLAGLFDPMLAVATSDVQPLPHQIRAVYGELLPVDTGRQGPLRRHRRMHC